jgi:hypothetical protein
LELITDLSFDFSQLTLACLVLRYLVKAKHTLRPNLINRGILFLYLIIIMEVVENTVEIGFMGGSFGDEDDITLEVLLVALAATATYYATKVKRTKSAEPLGVATLCTVWLVTAYTLELLLGLLLDVLFIMAFK